MCSCGTSDYPWKSSNNLQISEPNLKSWESNFRVYRLIIIHESRDKLAIRWPFYQGEFQTLLPRVWASSIAGPWLTTLSHPSTPILSTALCLGFKEKGNLNQSRVKFSVGCFLFLMCNRVYHFEILWWFYKSTGWQAERQLKKTSTTSV